jgi:hypothetical protein
VLRSPVTLHQRSPATARPRRALPIGSTAGADGGTLTAPSAEERAMSTSAAAPPRWTVHRVLPASALCAAAAGALLLPWWRADRGAVLLDGESVAALPPDVWTGVEVTGPWAVAVAAPAAVAVLMAVLTTTGLTTTGLTTTGLTTTGLTATELTATELTATELRRHRPRPDGANAALGAVDGPNAAFAPSGGRPTAGRLVAAARWTAAAAGALAVAVAGRALVGWGPSSAIGVWTTLLAGLGAVGCVWWLPTRGSRAPVRRAGRSGLVGRWPRHGALLGAVVAVVVLPSDPGPRQWPDAGPFVPIAAVGAFPLRSGTDGLAATDDVRPVLADGAPGVVSRAGVVVAVGGRARVLALPDRGAPAPIGVMGDRAVHWISADSVAVTGLHSAAPVDVVVRGVAEAGMLGADGSAWVRTDADPAGTVRRLDAARLVGRQRLAATWLPVVTIQEPEPPVDLRTVLPVRGGGLRSLAGVGRLELLTGTAAGITTTPLAGRRCGTAGVASLDLTAADRSGVWFVLVSTDGERLAHLDPDADGAIRTVAAVLPGTVTAVTAPGDGSLLFIARDAQGSALWQLPDATGTLGPSGEPPVTCPPAL